MPTQFPDALKPVEWIGSSREDLKQFPDEPRREVGFALTAAQLGGKAPSAKPLTGDKAFKGATAIEIVEDHDGDTYRAVYTTKLKGVVYVLHAFQKKSKSGIKTPQKDIDLIKRRLRQAEEHYAEHYEVRGAG